MAKWLVTHTCDGTNDAIGCQVLVEADTYEHAYIKVLCKSPVHYATGTIRSGIMSVIKVPDDYNIPAGLPTI